MSAIANRYEFVYLFDVTNGNPNGTQMPAICRVSTQKPTKVW